MDCKKILLPNKLRLLVIPMPGMESATLTIWVKTGSRFEADKTAGLSHFLEHMVFKGSKKRPSAKAIAEVVDSFGGEFNAGTSKEWTNFYIKARKDKVEIAFDVLADMVINPLLKPEEIAKEKGVICEEIAMYEDTPIMKIGDVFENLIYQDSTLGRDTIGNRKSVIGIKRNDFVSYRKMHYYPENMLVTVAGGVKEKDVTALTEKYFAGLKKNTTPPGWCSACGTPRGCKNNKPGFLLKTKKTDQTHLIIGFRGVPYGAPSRYAEALLSTILGGGMSSRLFLEVRERRGLAYAVKTTSDHALDNGYLACYAGVKTEKAGEAVAVILEQYYGISNSKFPISNKELLKAKEYLKGHLALSLEDTNSVNGFFGMEELYLGETKTPEEVYKAVDKVTVDEVYQVAKDFFRPEKLNLAIIGPFEDEEKFKKLLL